MVKETKNPRLEKLIFIDLARLFVFRVPENLMNFCRIVGFGASQL